MSRILKTLVAFVLLVGTAGMVAVAAVQAQTSDATYVTHGSNPAGWVVADGQRQWVSADCRVQLEAAGAQFVPTPWAEITQNPSVAQARPCADLAPPLPGPELNFRLVITTVNANGGHYLTATTRQWLSNACVAQLRQAGAQFESAAWRTFSGLTPVVNATSCDEIERQLLETPGAADPASFKGQVHVTSANADGGFYVVEGKRQWLSPACMDGLRAAGAFIVVSPWNGEASLPGLSSFENAAGLVNCDDLVAAWDSEQPALRYEAVQDPTDPLSVIVNGPGGVTQVFEGNHDQPCDGSPDEYEGEYWWCPDFRGSGDVSTYSVGPSSWDGRFQLIEHSYRSSTLFASEASLRALDRTTGNIVLLAYEPSQSPPLVSTGRLVGYSWVVNYAGTVTIDLLTGSQYWSCCAE